MHGDAPIARRSSVVVAAALAVAAVAVMTAQVTSGAQVVELHQTPAGSAARIEGANGVRSVVAVSLDGLNPRAIRALGPEGAPTLHRLVAEGASTLNARTSLKRTETLPNHTGLVTGRNVDRRHRGHGVEHNELRPGTVQDYAGHRVGSVWSAVRSRGGTGGLFVAKDKLVLFKRSWAIRRYALQPDNAALVTTALADVTRRHRAFRLVHLSEPDAAGHESGFMSAAYLDAVRRTDAQLGRIVDEIADTERLRTSTALVVTADHGGRGRRGHSQARRLVNYRVPFIVWGPGVRPGADLYRLNHHRADPGDRRPGWRAARQPVRNAEVANLSLDLLGLPAIRGSRANRAQDLVWR